MTAPLALIGFFQKEAAEYLDRLDALLAAADQAAPDESAFLSNARALRGSATMTRLDALPDLAAAIERIAGGLRDGALRWDQRLNFAVRAAVVELRALVALADQWGEAEARRSRTQSVALAAVAAGYLASPMSDDSPAAQIVPISRLFPDDGLPPVLYRNQEPPLTLAQRFRSDIAAAADGIAREAAALVASSAGPAQLAITDGLRRGLLGLADVADSYGATSISGLATSMARTAFETPDDRVAVQALSQLLMDRELSDAELAARVKTAAASWGGGATAAVPAAAAPAPRVPVRTATPPFAPPATQPVAQPVAQPVVPIETLLYRGEAALARAREVRDALRTSWRERGAADPRTSALFDELSDLLDLAATA
jgi:chemotaxis protein histidine kinase CheA